MPTVRFSKEFDERLTQHINSMRDAERKPKCPQGADSEVTIKTPSLLAMHEKWGEHRDLMGRMPKEWCSDRSRFDFRFKYKSEQYGERTIYVRVDCAETSLPPMADYRPDIDVDVEFLDDVTNDIEYPELATYRPTVHKLIAWYEFDWKWAKIYNDVSTFFKAYPSVNAALKAVPQMRMYVPAKYLKLIDADAERKSKPAPKIDVDSLTASAVEVQLIRSMGA